VPVNHHHPLTALPQRDELDYYWNVISDGFSGAIDVTHSYSYLEEDVYGTE